MIDTVRSRMEKIVASIVRTIADTFMKSDVISDAWVSGKTYAVGEYAISDGTLWKCKVANSVKPSEGSDWTAVKVADEIGYMQNVTFTRINPSSSNKMTGGYLDVIRQGNLVILRFKDVAFNLPSTGFEALVSNLPRQMYDVSTNLNEKNKTSDTIGLIISGEGTLYSYFNLTSLSGKSYSGELIYYAY